MGRGGARGWGRCSFLEQKRLKKLDDSEYARYVHHEDLVWGGAVRGWGGVRIVLEFGVVWRVGVAVAAAVAAAAYTLSNICVSDSSIGEL